MAREESTDAIDLLKARKAELTADEGLPPAEPRVIQLS